MLEAVRVAPEYNPASCALVGFLAELSATPPVELMADLRDSLLAVYTTAGVPDAVRRNVLVAFGVVAKMHAGPWTFDEERR